MLAEKGLAVAEEDTAVISAMIEGKRSDVNDAKKSGITASVDVSKCEKGRNNVDIIVNLPDGVKLESVSEEKLEIKVYERITEERPVNIGFSKKQDNQEEVAWVMSRTPETAYVSGAENLVEQISYIKGIIDIEQVSKNMKNLEAQLIPVDKNGEMVPGIELSYEIAYADVQLLASKTVNLDIKAENLQDGISLEKIAAADEVRIVGPKAVLENINELEGIIDLAGMTASDEVELSIQLPEGVYLYNESDVAAARVILKPAQ